MDDDMERDELKNQSETVTHYTISSRMLMLSGMLTASFSMLLLPKIATAVMEDLARRTFFQPIQLLSLFIEYDTVRVVTTACIISFLAFAEFNFKNRTLTQLIHLSVIWGTFFLGFFAFISLSIPMIPFDTLFP